MPNFFPNTFIKTTKMSSKPDVSCRIATLDDKQGILCIKENIYDGMDYLPDNYEVMFKDPNCYPYVLEKGGDIISFLCYWVIERGTVVIISSGRNKSEFEKKGYIKFLGQQPLLDIMRKHPNIKKYRYSFRTPYYVKHIAKNPGWGSVMGRYVYIEMRVTGPKWRMVTTENLVYAKDVLSRPDRGVLRVGSVPGNLILCRCPIVTPILATWENVADVAEEYPVYVTMNDVNECTALSTSGHYKIRDTICLFISYAGDHPGAFQLHFQHHVTSAVKRQPEQMTSFFIKLYIPHSLMGEDITRILKETGDIMKANEYISAELQLAVENIQHKL